MDKILLGNRKQSLTHLTKAPPVNTYTKFLISANCEFDESLGDGSSNFCPGYSDAVVTPYPGVKDTKLQALADVFCTHCPIEDHICSQLFCTPDRLIVSVAMAAMSSFCDNIQSTFPACYSEFCSSSVNKREVNLETGSITSSPGCTASSGWSFVAGIDQWCKNNCQAGNDPITCPENYCHCPEPEGTTVSVNNLGDSCTRWGASVVWLVVPGMDTWCENACSSGGDCPQSHCQCVETTTTTSTSTTTPTTSSSTTSPSTISTSTTTTATRSTSVATPSTTTSTTSASTTTPSTTGTSTTTPSMTPSSTTSTSKTSPSTSTTTPSASTNTASRSTTTPTTTTSTTTSTSSTTPSTTWPFQTTPSASTNTPSTSTTTPTSSTTPSKTSTTSTASTTSTSMTTPTTSTSTSSPSTTSISTATTTTSTTTSSTSTSANTPSSTSISTSTTTQSSSSTHVPTTAELKSTESTRMLSTGVTTASPTVVPSVNVTDADSQHVVSQIVCDHANSLDQNLLTDRYCSQQAAPVQTGYSSHITDQILSFAPKILCALTNTAGRSDACPNMFCGENPLAQRLIRSSLCSVCQELSHSLSPTCAIAYCS